MKSDVFVFLIKILNPGLGGISGQKCPKIDIFGHNATLDFDETWPKVAKYGFLWLGMRLYAGKILVFELTPLILSKQ